MRREHDVVKKLQDGAVEPTLPPDFRRHLRGYELGLLTVAMVLTFALLTLPRASEPTTLPLPRIDRLEASRREAHEQELLIRAERDGLPFDIRAVGEALRRFGTTTAEGYDALHEREDIQERVRIALGKHLEQGLLTLRAVQTEYFLDALAQFERDGTPNRDLQELGGDFLAHAQQSGWFDDHRHCLADTTTLSVMFRWRWAELIERPRAFPFAPSLNELRIYYRFLLLHPERLVPAQDAALDDEARVTLVTALARHDPEYPEAFAKGYLLYRLGNREAAAAEFRAQLGRSDSGAYALLARNNLIYALQDVGSE